MNETSSVHRLEGMEPDNLLAVLAFLGAAQALEAADGQNPVGSRWFPRLGWDLDSPPLRPQLHLQVAVDAEEIGLRIDCGLERLSSSYRFGGRKDLDFSLTDARKQLTEAALGAQPQSRHQVDLLSAIMSDAIDQSNKPGIVDPSPLCLLRGGGHQYFLDHLSRVHDAYAVGYDVGRVRSLCDTLFKPWGREDDLSSSFRWDPKEAVQYALMAGDPTTAAYKCGTQFGANLLAAVGFSCFSVVAQQRRQRRRPAIPGGQHRREFAVAWPIWRHPTTLATVRSLFSHPGLWEERGLEHLGVETVFVAYRMMGRLMNFSHGELLYA